MAGKKSGSSGGKRGRSAGSGRFVKQSTVKENPKTTVNESVKRKKKLTPPVSIQPVCAA